MPDNLQKVMFDGISIETTDQGAQAIGKLQGLLKDAATALDTAKATNDAAIAAKDAEIAKRDAEIDALKAKVLGDADIDKKIADRGDLIAVATAIVADVKTAGVPDADIKKAVVVAKRGAACADKSAAYIDAAFDILADEARATMDAQDQVRSALGGIIVPTVADKAVVDARAAMIAELHSGKAN